VKNQCEKNVTNPCQVMFS